MLRVMDSLITALRKLLNYANEAIQCDRLQSTSKICVKVCVTSATRLFLYSIQQLSTAPVLVFQIIFYWASLYVCVLSYPLQLS